MVGVYTADIKTLIKQAYSAFNKRDIDGALGHRRPNHCRDYSDRRVRITSNKGMKSDGSIGSMWSEGPNHIWRHSNQGY